MGQWLGLLTLNAGGLSSIPGRELNPTCRHQEFARHNQKDATCCDRDTAQPINKQTFKKQEAV